MILSIASDHGGFELKNIIKGHLATYYSSYTIIDRGTTDLSSVNYPDFADAVAKDIVSGTADLGILICGTGIGISIRANRYHGIRAALVNSVFTAEMAKAHNNANVLCLGGRTTEPDLAVQLIDTWLTTSFEGGRHATRVEMLDADTK
jgi:ribose 5-phosphate isomerase B